MQTCATSGSIGIARRCGKLAFDHFEERGRGDADVDDAGADEHRDDLLAARLVVQIAAHLVERRFDAFEQFFEEMVVEIAERFEQLRARLVDGRSQFAVDRNLARRAVLGDIRVALREIDVTAKFAAAAERNLFCDDAPSVRFDQRRQSRAKIAARLIEFVDEEHVGSFARSRDIRRAAASA